MPALSVAFPPGWLISLFGVGTGVGDAWGIGDGVGDSAAFIVYAPPVEFEEISTPAPMTPAPVKLTEADPMLWPLTVTEKRLLLDVVQVGIPNKKCGLEQVGMD